LPNARWQQCYPEKGRTFNKTSLVTNDEGTWDLLGPPQEWDAMTVREQRAFNSYMGEFARQAVFRSDLVSGESAMEVLLPTSGMEVSADIVHFGSLEKNYRLLFSEVKMGYVGSLNRTQLFGFRRLVGEGIAKARNLFLLLSPSGGYGIGGSAASDANELGFAKPIGIDREWWKEFY